MDQPQLWVFAGPNGAGKSTIADHYVKDRIPVVNPDNIARDLPRTPDGRLDEREAGKRALVERKGRLAARENFAIETTMSGNSELNLMRDASAAGFKVNLVYVGIPNAAASAARVSTRVQAGGHDVPLADTDRRYARTMENLPEAMRIADRTFVLDNSGERHRLLLTRENDRTRFEARSLPAWAVAAIPADMRRDPQLVRADHANLRVVETTIARNLSNNPGEASALAMSAKLAIQKGAIDGKPAPTVAIGRQAERVPDGAEKVSVMNGSRLHESYRDGQWTVQTSDPQGMLPRGVYRLDKATPVKPETDRRYDGAVLHVGKAGVYQLHGDTVLRHDRSRFQQVPSIGEAAKIEYSNGRATLANRAPQSPAPPGPGKLPDRNGPDRER